MFSNGTRKTSKDLEAVIAERRDNVYPSKMVVLVDPFALTGNDDSFSESMAKVHNPYIDVNIAWMRINEDDPNQVRDSIIISCIRIFQIDLRT